MARARPNRKVDLEAKQFGKLTGKQIKSAVDIRTTYSRRIKGMLPELLRSEMVRKIEDELGPLTWSWIYDLPDVLALILAMRVLGFDKDVADAAKQANPTAAILEQTERELKDDTPIEVPEGIELDALRVALILAWHFNDVAISYYSISINGLVARGAAGDDHAFLKAVSIDPSASGSEQVGRRIGRAKVLRDRAFLAKYRAALLGPTQKRHTLRKLRWTDYLFRDIDARGAATMQEIYDLVTQVLNQYPESGKDPVRSLRSRLDEWRRQASS